ncbi:MAG: hypothetical protein GY715_15690, partial [Planctomycetes bacterium]|nr:hypothetical protein [Planctomycetota bacterium]
GDGDHDTADRSIIYGIVYPPSSDGSIDISEPEYDVDADLNRNGAVDRWDYTNAKGGRAALALGMLSDPNGPDGSIGWDGYVYNAATDDCVVRHRWYNTGLGRWLERDPVVDARATGPTWPPTPQATMSAEYRNLYRYARNSPATRVDPSGLKCCIRVRCHPVYEYTVKLGYHCGLVVCDDSGCFSYDGSGGSIHSPGTGFWDPKRPLPGTLSPNNCGFSDSVCKCLRAEPARWAGLNIPRDHGCANSNWHLKCATKKCGIKINWTRGNDPIGWNCRGYICAEFHPDSSSSSSSRGGSSSGGSSDDGCSGRRGVIRCPCP